MPVYDFKCTKCTETRTESISIHDENPVVTCKCGAEMRKVFGSPPVIFRGNGFYKTDK